MKMEEYKEDKNKRKMETERQKIITLFDKYMHLRGLKLPCDQIKPMLECLLGEDEYFEIEHIGWTRCDGGRIEKWKEYIGTSPEKGGKVRLSQRSIDTISSDKNWHEEYERKHRMAEVKSDSTFEPWPGGDSYW